MQNLSLFESNSQPFTVDNHLSFNFNDPIKQNLTTFYSLTETKSYTPITGCVLEHIITTINLTNYEKLYYLLADSLALINKNKGYSRYCALPSEDWAEYLGCSRSLVFTMQRSLLKKGYFIINKDFDEIGRNNRNLITPTLPTSVFNHLNERYPDRVGDHAPFNPLRECKKSYLDRTKLFIKLNYNLLKLISCNEHTNPRQKTMWLGFYTRCYKNYMLSVKEDFNVSKYSYNDDSSFSFITSYNELADLYSCSTKHISKSIRALKKLGFISVQNIYIRKRCGGSEDCGVQERQDKSLWKITLSLPDECIAELEKVKNRSNLKLKNIKDELVTAGNSIDPKLIEDYLILGGVKFNLNLEQSHVLKSLIGADSNDSRLDGADVNYNGNIDTILPLPNNSCDESYIDSVMEELDVETTWKVEDKLEKSFRVDDSKFLSDEPKTLSTSSSLEELDKKIEKKDGIKSDPHVAKSGLLLNKDLISKIKDIKSNLGLTPKVLFNNFLKRFSQDELGEDVGSNKEEVVREKEFDIHSELIRAKLKMLPKDKADKARKFAYSLVSKGLAIGYAANLSKHELAKQIIHHAATWKPTKLGVVSREKEIDAALSVAWKAIVAGTWKTPLELAKAETLQYEFRYYKQKYLESGIISNELSSLESATNKLLKTSFIDLKGKIIKDLGFYISCHNAVITKMEANEDRNFNALLDHSKNIELPSYLEDREYYLSYGYRDHSYMNNDDNRNESLISGTEYKDTNITGNDENGQNNSIKQILDLSTISEKQRYLRMNCSEKNNEMIVKTVNDTEYLFKLKTMEVNEEGDTVMTLKHVKLKAFIEEANNEFLNDGSNVEFKGLKDNYLTKNTFSIQNQEPFQITDTQVNSIGTVEKRAEQDQPVQIKQSLNTGFIGQEASKTNIDTALSNILKNIQREVE